MKPNRGFSPHVSTKNSMYQLSAWSFSETRHFLAIETQWLGGLVRDAATTCHLGKLNSGPTLNLLCNAGDPMIFLLADHGYSCAEFGTTRRSGVVRSWLGRNLPLSPFLLKVCHLLMAQPFADSVNPFPISVCPDGTVSPVDFQ